MRPRHGWLILLGAALAAAGCQDLPPRATAETAVGGGAAAGGADGKELPPAEAARVCLATADLLFRKGQDREAAVLYEKARTADPRQKQVCRRLAVLYDRLGDFPAAEAEYQKALKLYPKSADVRNDLGYSCYGRGRWPEAEKHLREALALDGKHKRAAINLGMALAQQGKAEEALEAFGRAVTPAQAQANLAFILTAQGKAGEARAAYRKALEMDPNLTLARAALAKLDGTAPPVQPEGRKIGVRLAKPRPAQEPLPGGGRSLEGFRTCPDFTPNSAADPAPPAAAPVRPVPGQIHFDAPAEDAGGGHGR